MLRRFAPYFGVGLVAGLIAWLPAAWFTRALPNNLHCEVTTGTIWSGHCAELRIAGSSVGALSWQLHPLALLHGTINAALEWRADSAVDAGHGAAVLSLSIRDRRRLVLSSVNLTSRLAELRRVAPNLPLPFGIDGELQATLKRIEVVAGLPELIDGRAALVRLRGTPTALELASGFEFESVPGATQTLPIVRIIDIGDGGVGVRGSLTFVRPRGCQLELVLQPRRSNPTLREAISQLGPTDTDGAARYSLDARW